MDITITIAEFYKAFELCKVCYPEHWIAYENLLANISDPFSYEFALQLHKFNPVISVRNIVKIHNKQYYLMKEHTNSRLTVLLFI